ncbi:hypothetical protein GGTG_05527 [Gaeumannomyces tritici R3-111a-1]|uniref:Hydrophobin n=1 Tax=Gaeumannomyces tritici (strain R3-111a-1) TaxID=644352 RepID=J3NW62_GAET3|nr:hypothetical protein GGTG_05527 [Gaeumannomyces tritici R3-111a-1]EJT75594.1 hypothetical protein GGTG_05527 [Gaeumannomyces tritici R3-111a-1]
MHFSGLIVALSTGLAAASPIVEKKDSGLCPKWGGLPELWHGLACCGWGNDPTSCCRLPADTEGAYKDSLPCTSEWFETVTKYVQLVDCNRPEPVGNCAGVPVLGKKP